MRDFLKNIESKISTGENFILVDTNGSIVDNLINNNYNNKDFLERVELLDFTTTDCFLGLNIFDTNNITNFNNSIEFFIEFLFKNNERVTLDAYETYRNFIINIIKTIDTVRHLYTPTIYDIKRFLVTEDYMAYIVSYLDPDNCLVNYWYDFEIGRSDNNEGIINLVDNTLNLLSIFDNKQLFNILSQKKNTIDYVSIDKKIVLGKFSKDILSEFNSKLLSKFLVHQISSINNNSKVNIFFNDNKELINKDTKFNELHYGNISNYNRLCKDFPNTVEELFNLDGLIKVFYKKNYSSIQSLHKSNEKFTNYYKVFSSNIME